MGRAARGVRGISLAKDQRLVGVTVGSDPEQTLLTVCANGYGQRSKLKEYRLTRRGGKGIRDIQTQGRNGPVVGSAVVRDNDEIILMSSSGVMMRTSVKEVRMVGRGSSGVRIMRTDEGAVVASLAVVPFEEAEEEPEEGGKE
jgi:DNA gyrase subunit A